MTNYQLPNLPRFDEWAEDQEVISVRRELSAARAILELAITQGKLPLAASLLNTVGKLTLAESAALKRAGEVLPRARLVEVVKQTCTLFLEEFENSCPDWQDRVDRVAEKLNLMVHERPRDAEPKRIAT
jgi:hypothetical protein